MQAWEQQTNKRQPSPNARTFVTPNKRRRGDVNQSNTQRGRSPLGVASNAFAQVTGKAQLTSKRKLQLGRPGENQPDNSQTVQNKTTTPRSKRARQIPTGNTFLALEASNMQCMAEQDMLQSMDTIHHLLYSHSALASPATCSPSLAVAVPPCFQEPEGEVASEEWADLLHAMHSLELQPDPSAPVFGSRAKLSPRPRAFLNIRLRAQDADNSVETWCVPMSWLEPMALVASMPWYPVVAIMSADMHDTIRVYIIRGSVS